MTTYPATSHLTTFDAENTIVQAFSVSEVNALVSDAIAATLPAQLRVEGEISNLSVAASGHRYFSLKDSNSTISCALFRGAAGHIPKAILSDLSNGDKVIARANVSVYQPRGSYQLIVNDIEPAGFGALAKAFALLKKKLDQAGLTSTDRKRPVPTWPRSIAVVTSNTGAAVRDVLTTLEHRAPFIDVTVYPTLVQGGGAPEQIVDAIALANKAATTEVILLVRGGGSLEDLQAFNEESVAMAVAGSHLPIITGVGHETDFTIVDFVSDVRAATPTAAAQLASPDKGALAQVLQKNQSRLSRAMRHRQSIYQQQLDSFYKRLSNQHPAYFLRQQSQKLDEISLRLSREITQQLQTKRQQLRQYQHQLQAVSPNNQLVLSRQRLQTLEMRFIETMRYRLAGCQQTVIQKQSELTRFTERLGFYRQQLKGFDARLTLLSPLGVLARGYALAFDEDGKVVRHYRDVNAGDTLRVRLLDGEIMTIAQSTTSKS